MIIVSNICFKIILFHCWVFKVLYFPTLHELWQ